MGKATRLTWHKARGVWRKKYKGQVYYLSKSGECKGPKDTAGYGRALSKWLAKKSELEAEEEQHSSLPEWIRYFADGTSAAQLAAMSQHSSTAVAPLAARFATDYSRLPPELPLASRPLSGDVCLADLIDSYLTEIRRKAEAGKRAISTFREAKDKLADFQGYANKYQRSKINDVDAPLLKCYRDEQLNLVEQSEISAYTAKKRLAAVKRFLEWAYEHEYLNRLPRNVSRNFIQVDLPDPDPQPFTKEELKQIFNAASEKGQFSRKSNKNALYVLLGLNCGYGPTDIATLKHEHIDWNTLVIRRKREKTGSPQVHKLWRVTAAVLRDEMTNPSKHALMLLDERGKPLVIENIDGKTAKTDSIGRMFGRLKAKLGWSGPNRGFKILRKTGADTLKKQFPAMPHVYKQYLGHKEQDVSRHYVREHYENLFEALDWMESYFDLAP